MSDMSDNAFPTEVASLDNNGQPLRQYEVERSGLTKREYVATTILAAMMNRNGFPPTDDQETGICRSVVRLADTLLKVCANA